MELLPVPSLFGGPSEAEAGTCAPWLLSLLVAPGPLGPGRRDHRGVGSGQWSHLLKNGSPAGAGRGEPVGVGEALACVCPRLEEPEQRSFQNCLAGHGSRWPLWRPQAVLQAQGRSQAPLSQVPLMPLITASPACSGHGSEWRLGPWQRWTFATRPCRTCVLAAVRGTCTFFPLFWTAPPPCEQGPCFYPPPGPC